MGAARCFITGGQRAPTQGQCDTPGGVVERFKALVLKTSVPKGTVGSNPTPSANSFSLSLIWQSLSCLSLVLEPTHVRML